MEDGSVQSNYERNAEYLRGHPDFAELPTRFRELVLKSPHASSDFASFYANGGRIVGDPSESLASYRSTNKTMVSAIPECSVVRRREEWMFQLEPERFVVGSELEAGAWPPPSNGRRYF